MFASAPRPRLGIDLGRIEPAGLRWTGGGCAQHTPASAHASGAALSTLLVPITTVCLLSLPCLVRTRCAVVGTTSLICRRFSSASGRRGGTRWPSTSRTEAPRRGRRPSHLRRATSGSCARRAQRRRAPSPCSRGAEPCAHAPPPNAHTVSRSALALRLSRRPSRPTRPFSRRHLLPKPRNSPAPLQRADAEVRRNSCATAARAGGHMATGASTGGTSPSTWVLEVFVSGTVSLSVLCPRMPRKMLHAHSWPKPQ